MKTLPICRALLALMAEERVARGEVSICVMDYPESVIRDGVFLVTDAADALAIGLAHLQASDPIRAKLLDRHLI